MTVSQQPRSRRGEAQEHGEKRPFDVPGGSLGLKSGNLTRIKEQVRAGFGYDLLARFARTSQLPLESIMEVVQIPRRTLARRKAAGKLTQEESERLLRLAMVYEKAVNLFEGNAAAARDWLARPRKSLGNESPLAAAETEVGAREVEDLIGRLEHGVFS